VQGESVGVGVNDGIGQFPNEQGFETR
jgi:hypothetical protein